MASTEQEKIWAENRLLSSNGYSLCGAWDMDGSHSEWVERRGVEISRADALAEIRDGKAPGSLKMEDMRKAWTALSGG